MPFRDKVDNGKGSVSMSFAEIFKQQEALEDERG